MNKSNNDSNNLAIIGASGTGKTVLAVGLHATSTPEFSVSTPPGAEETRKYIEVRQSALEEGYWPAATNESDNIDLRLRLHANGKQSDIVFREYMGERMEKDPNYIRGVIGTPKAAMILFNPGMPGLQSAESRNKMIGNLKVIAQHLKDNKCAAVALVVTASDRLSSDLANFREEFEQYVSLITNHLGTLQLNWKRFDVTVSGELADQNKPKLAVGENNTTHEPFLWLLDCIHTQKVKGRVRKVTGWVTGITLGALAVWGCLWARSKSNLSDIEDKIAGIEAKLTNAWMRKSESEVNNQLSELQKQSTNTLPAVLIVGSGNRDIAVRLEQRLTDDIDLWGVRSLRLEYDAINAKLDRDPLLLSSEKWAKDFDDCLKVTKPSETTAVSELDVLRQTWSTNRIPMETKWQVAKLNKDVDEKVLALRKADGETIPNQLSASYKFIKDIPQTYPLAENGAVLSARLDVARTNALARYCVWIAKWSPYDEKRPFASDDLRRQLEKSLSGKITPDEFRATETNLLAQLAKAQVEWDKYQFPTRAQKHIDALKSGNEPVSALKESLSFLGSMTNDFPTISLGERLLKQDTINHARKVAINSYSSSITNTWDVNGKRLPEFDVKRIFDTELTDAVVTSDEAKAFEDNMQKCFTKAKEDWRAVQKNNCDSFVSRYLSSTADVLGSLNEYMGFRNTNLKNPFLKEVDLSMTTLLEKRLDWLVAEYYRDFRSANAVWDSDLNRSVRMKKAQDEFDELRRLCLAIKNKMLEGSPVQSSWVDGFASLCIEYGGLRKPTPDGINAAFQQEFKVSEIDVKVDFDYIDSDFEKLALGIGIRSRYWNEGERISMDETLINNYNTAFLKNEGGKFYCVWDDKKGAKSFYLSPWTDSFVTINWEDNVDWATDPSGYFSFNIWPERYKRDGDKNGYIEFTRDIEDKYCRFKITVHVVGTLTGFDLQSLMNQAKSHARK